MFNEDLRIRYKSETGIEPYIELDDDNPVEETLMIAGGSIYDFPLNKEDYMSVPTRDYIEWLEQRALKTLEQ